METRSSLSRSLHTNRGLEKLEPYEGKLSCTVLRGEEGSNALDLPDQTKETMDIHLLLTNKQHRLFGDLELAWGDSRMEDMLSDESSYCDYSNMKDELCGYLERMIGQSQPQ